MNLKIENPPVTLRELCLDKVRNAIITGYFPSGKRLVERSLCEELGVSRSVVREVIRYLEAEGLVEILPNTGKLHHRFMKFDYCLNKVRLLIALGISPLKPPKH
jgi:DNA-binding FadR family transcriptional regulator